MKCQWNWILSLSQYGRHCLTTSYTRSVSSNTKQSVSEGPEIYWSYWWFLNLTNSKKKKKPFNSWSLEVFQWSIGLWIISSHLYVLYIEAFLLHSILLTKNCKKSSFFFFSSVRWNSGTLNACTILYPFQC